MPFRNSPDNMQALQMLGQTLVNGRQNEAQMRLRVALAQQAAARQARHDALQAGVWEAQAGRAKTQAALDAAKQKEIDSQLAAIEGLASVMSDTNNTPESAAMRAALARVAGFGRQHIVENAAQINALPNPDLAARMATGTKIPDHLPAGATALDYQGNPTVTAPFPPEHQFGSLANILGSIPPAIRQMQPTEGVAPSPEKQPDIARRYSTVTGVQDAVMAKILELLKSNTNAAPQQPMVYPRQTAPQGQPALPLPVPSAPAPVPSIPVPSTNTPSWLQREDIQATPARFQEPNPGMVEFILDEKTGQIVPVTRPLER